MKLLIENFKNYIHESNLSEFDDGGVVNLYHYTNPRNVKDKDSVVLDPQLEERSRRVRRQAPTPNVWITKRFRMDGNVERYSFILQRRLLFHWNAEYSGLVQSY